MRTAVFFLTLALVAWVGHTLPRGYEQKHISPGIPYRFRRSLPDRKGLPPVPVSARPSQLEFNVRKGEYVCGDRICKLEPGVVPKGCNGRCQYPL